MSNKEVRAEQLLKEAEKKLMASKSFLASLFGNSGKLESAVEYYQRAGNMYKMSKNWQGAASAFHNAASLSSDLCSPHQAATNFVDAANCYKKVEPEHAIQCLTHAIDIYLDLGKFLLAAKYNQVIGDIYSDKLKYKEAMQHYEAAADYYRSDESNSQANKCLIQVAQFAAFMKNYKKAIECYEQAVIISKQNSLLKYCSKEYVFKALLCHTCLDIAQVKPSLHHYLQACPSFEDSKEYKLIQVILECGDGADIEKFTEVSNSWVTSPDTDLWIKTMLGRVKIVLGNPPNIC